jgi:hypothetical protein
VKRVKYNSGTKRIRYHDILDITIEMARLKNLSAYKIGTIQLTDCILKKAFGSAGAWASSVSSPSPYVCGYIHSRALVGIFLNICAGLDITGTIRTAYNSAGTDTTALDWNLDW